MIRAICAFRNINWLPIIKENVQAEWKNNLYYPDHISAVSDCLLGLGIFVSCNVSYSRNRPLQFRLCLSEHYPAVAPGYWNIPTTEAFKTGIVVLSRDLPVRRISAHSLSLYSSSLLPRSIRKGPKKLWKSSGDRFKITPHFYFHSSVSYAVKHPPIFEFCRVLL